MKEKKKYVGKSEIRSSLDKTEQGRKARKNPKN